MPDDDGVADGSIEPQGRSTSAGFPAWNPDEDEKLGEGGAPNAGGATGPELKRPPTLPRLDAGAARP